MIYGFILWIGVSIFTKDLGDKTDNSNKNIIKDIKIEGNGNNTFNQNIYNVNENHDTLSKNKIPFRFEDNDTILNILITKFENTNVNEINDKTTRCVGEKFEGELYELVDKKLLRINPVYLDHVGSPKNLKQVKELQAKHNADLIIHGKAEVVDTCSQAKFCFNYNLADTVANILPPPSLFKSNRKPNFDKFNGFEDLISGELSIDGKNLEAWILPYVALKDKDIEKALRGIKNLNKLNIHCFNTASIYRQKAWELMFFDKKYLEAERFCLKALEINKCDIEARKLLSQNYENTSQWEKAKKQSNLILSLQRNRLGCYSKRTYLGLAYFDKECGNYLSAIGRYNSFTGEYNAYKFNFCDDGDVLLLGLLGECEKPKDYYLGKAYFNRAICHASLGNKIYACRDISKALENNYQLEWQANEIIDTYKL